jgi:hypothetical protein
MREKVNKVFKITI